MKAAVLTRTHAPLEIRDVPIPPTGAQQVLVQVNACGICLTDLQTQEDKFPHKQLPLILGYEAAGIIAEVGEGVRSLAVGERVVIDPIISCDSCYYCVRGLDNRCERMDFVGFLRDGAYAEFAAVPAKNCFPIPDNLPFEQAAVIPSALATAYHAVVLARIAPGDTVVILGAGNIGMLSLQLSKAYGAGRIIMVDRHSDKLALCSSLGATMTIDNTAQDPVRTVRDLTAGRGADIVLEMAGSPETIWQSIAMTRDCGTDVLVGVHYGPLELAFRDYYADVLRRELTIRSSASYSRWEFPRLIGLVVSGLIDLRPSVTMTIPLEAVNEGFAMMREHRQMIYRIILKP